MTARREVRTRRRNACGGYDARALPFAGSEASTDLAAQLLYEFPTGVGYQLEKSGRSPSLDVVPHGVIELGTRDPQIDPRIERCDPRPRQIGLGIDELDGRRALGVEQLLADAVALLGCHQALLRRRQRALRDRHRLLRGEHFDPGAVLEVLAVRAQLVGLGADPALVGSRDQRVAQRPRQLRADLPGEREL